MRLLKLWQRRSLQYGLLRMEGVKKRLVLISGASEALGLSAVEAESEEHIFLDVKVQTKRGKRRLHALLDSGAQGNFISQAIVLEEDITCEKTATCVNGVGGHSVAVYGYVSVETHVTDMRGIARWGCHFYYAAALDGVELILGMPWLKSVNPDVNWAECEWFYRESRTTIRTDSPKAFLAYIQ